MKKLFYDNVYLSEWESEIIEINEKDDKFYIALSETAFYPEGGGQPSDRGEIDGIKVIDVKEVDDMIYHILESKPKNKRVLCKLDYERRFDLMQQHTGQHLFSAIFYNKYKGETSSFHLGDDYVSVDISIGDMPSEMAKDVESLANEYIYKNIDVITHVVTSNELGKFPLRKLPPTDEAIRIVELDKVDFSPCCGTHVSKTGEIGIIKILKTEKYKGATRIYLKCGNRALKDFQNKTDIILNLGKYLSVPESEITERVENLNNEIKTFTKQVNELKERLFEYEAKGIMDLSDSKIISMNFNDRSFNEIQTLARIILQKGDYMLILSSSSDNKLLLSHNGNFNIDCGKFLKEHMQNFGGKGGGNQKQAQAAFQDIVNLNKFREFIEEAITIL